MGPYIQNVALMLLNRIDLRLSDEERALDRSRVSKIVRERCRNWITAHLRSITPEELLRIFIGVEPLELKALGAPIKPFESFERPLDAMRHYAEEMIIIYMVHMLKVLEYPKYGICHTYNELVHEHVMRFRPREFEGQPV